MLEIRKASAGSGKTFQLARKYVLNVLSTTDKSGNLTLNPDPTEAHRRILAITFTNKAT
ncbi:MAG: UvrD-helicase domain-containing protein, partial [Muribaculaceae bacterium]|nr:UvrD-helicase domain-containing protein [Muribaculaceae bacterium]